VAAIVVAALVVIFSAQFLTEVAWFSAIGFSRVLWTGWIARAVLFVGGFAVMAIAVYAGFTVAHKNRPIYAPTGQEATLDQYREAVEPLRKGVIVVIPLVIGFFAGLSAAGEWKNVLLAINSEPFGNQDPQFGLDAGFYVFHLPVLRALVTFLIAVVVVSALAALVTHYLYGGIRIGGQAAAGGNTTPAARMHLSIMAALLMLLLAAQYFLDRYSLLTSPNDTWDGASYSDVHALIPSRGILAGVAVLVAVAFIVGAIRKNWRLPLIGVGLMVVSAIIVGGVYPAVIQRFHVNPNAQELETPYIQRNLEATQFAFGLDAVTIQQYEATAKAEPGALRQDAETTAQIRLLDPHVVSPSFRQLQQNKQYYDFADVLSVDRYTIDDESRDTIIAVRELNLDGLGNDQRNWVNDHTVYTHGFGVVAAFGNTTGPDGRPAFFEGGIPTQGALTDSQNYEPRIYFSPSMTSYSVVGAPADRTPWELDYQADDESGGGRITTAFPTQDVTAGPSIKNLWQQLLFAIKFGDEQLVFSDRVTSESQILFNRGPRERVKKVAPYLTLDNRVYPAVVDGRVKWIVDGYTTADSYPYSTAKAMSETVTAAMAAERAAGVTPMPNAVNYIRNAVKATVDAYDGSVTLYAWDAEDPLLKAWNNIYPGTVSPLSEISGDLMSHLRYPEDMFKVQRAQMQRYHVQDPAQFFSGQDLWATPQDPTITGDHRPLQPPYYLTLQMPDQPNPAFSLTSLFIPGGNTDREILTGFLAADAEAGNVDGVRGEGYGKLRLLQMPRDHTVPGPGQVQNNFNTNPTISQQLNLLEIGSSVIRRGNQLTLPVGGGLLYVQPIYVQSDTGTQFPLLRRVLVAFGEDGVGFAPTLSEALDQVFGGDAGAEAGDAGDAPESVPSDEVPSDAVPGDEVPAEVPSDDAPSDDAPAEVPPTDPIPDPGQDTTVVRSELESALADASQAMKDSADALSAGDWAAYGAAQDALQAALERAVAAEAALGN
jgi:uncharacterized membrane protein (UPF0182 family)